MGVNFIPDAHAAFNGWQEILMSNVGLRASDWKIPPEEVAAAQVLQARWTAAYAVSEDLATRTKGAVKEKQEARDAYEAGLRRLIRSYMTYNPLITDKDRDDIGLPIHKRSRTPAPVADRPPALAVSYASPRRLRFDFGAEKGSPAKPPGQHGAEISTVISDAKPAEIEDLVRSSFSTHTPLILTFKESERGKTLWFAVRWENICGKKGPWSEIESTIIP